MTTFIAPSLDAGKAQAKRDNDAALHAALSSSDPLLLRGHGVPADVVAARIGAVAAHAAREQAIDVAWTLEDLAAVVRTPFVSGAGGVTAQHIKAEAHRRIVAVCPEWRQRNMTARGLELTRRGEATWTAEEQAEVAAIEAVWIWIKAVRQASNALEAELPINYVDDACWPAPMVP